MDPNGRNESVPDGLIEAVASANHETYSKQGTPDKVAKDPAATGATGAQGGVKPLKPKTNTETEIDDAEEEDAGDNAEGLDEQDFSRQPVSSETTDDETEATTTEPLQTNTETQTAEDDAWKKDLPSPPPEFKLTAPKPDEFGQIDPQDYTTYVTEKAKAEIRQESYNQLVVTRSFEEAEKVLPELKTNPVIQGLVRQTYLSQVYSGEAPDVVKVARDIKSLLGGAKSEGVQSAKTSITIQKNAAVETKGATQKKASPSKADNLVKRLAKNDTSAFEELMSDWQTNKKV